MKHGLFITLLKYLTGLHLFVPVSSYANPMPPFFNFSPALFSPSPFQRPSFLPQGSSILPLCPPQMPPGLCLSLTSVPMTNTPPYGLPSAVMMTPFLAQPKEISKTKSNQLLQKGKWRSYRYSKEKHEYQPLSQEERDNRDPGGDYIHLREETPPAPISQTPPSSQESLKEKPPTQPDSSDRTQPSSPETTQPDSSEKTQPSSPETTQPDSSEKTQPSSPETTQPDSSEKTQPSSPETTQPDSPETTQPDSSEITQPSPPERTQPSFYENAIIESKGKIYTGRTSVIPTTALAIEDRQKPDSEESPQASESPVTEEIRVVESVNPIETVVGKPETPSCADLSDNTESQVLCIECLSNRSEQKAISKFSSSFEDKFKAHKICVNEGFDIMNKIEDNFNNNCQPFHFQEYVTELACQSCQAQIPPALMLSVMTIESTGRCAITGDDGSSHGLFQINNNSSPFPSCNAQQTSTIKKGPLDQLRREPACLQNPMINLQESLRILSEKYRSTNNNQSQNFQCRSSDPINTDAWRKAIAGYNGGQRRILNIQEVIAQKGKPNALSQTAWDQMSEWEKIRTYYFSCARRDVSHCPSEDFKPSISNLAHTEVLLGASDQSPSLFTAWSQQTQLNDTSHCH